MAQQCVLFAGGYSPWKIVLASDPSPSVRYAAEEFAMFFEQLCGARLPIISDSVFPASYEIVIGESLRTSDDCGCPKDIAGGEDVWYQIREDRVVIAGGGLRGTLYSVYEFLENECGVRFFTPSLTHVPRRDSVILPVKTHSYHPPLEYREVFYYNPCHSADWCARNRVNGGHAPLAEKHCGAVRWHGFCHTFQARVPPEQYAETHPEYYSLKADGTRATGRRAQLCLTNPDVLRIATEQVKTWLREHPDATIVSVSQMDGTTPETMLPCLCDECRKVDEYEGGHSGTILHFVNKIAEAIEEEFPYASIDTIAYAYSIQPPKHVKARRNVIIRPCFRDPDLLAEWYRVCPRLYIWDYVTNFRHYAMTFPNYDTIAPNIRSLIENHITGIFAQGVYDTPGLDFEELKAYLFAKLLWNPSLNTEQLINEFMAAYFGPAGAPLKRYLDVLRAKIRDENLPLLCFCNLPVPYITPEIIEFGKACFDAAERLAGTPEILRRVQQSRLSLMFMELMYTPKGSPGRDEAIDRFFDRVQYLGVLLVSERNKLPEARQRMKEMSGLYELAKEIPHDANRPDEI